MKYLGFSVGDHDNAYVDMLSTVNSIRGRFLWSTHPEFVYAFRVKKGVASQKHSSLWLLEF